MLASQDLAPFNRINRGAQRGDVSMESSPDQQEITLAGILPSEMQKEAEEIRGISHYRKETDQIKE